MVEELVVSPQTINAIETGKYDPSLPLAFKMAKLIVTTIEGIFTPSDLNKPRAISRYHCGKATCTCRGTGAVRHGQTPCYKRDRFPAQLDDLHKVPGIGGEFV